MPETVVAPPVAGVSAPADAAAKALADSQAAQAATDAAAKTAADAAATAATEEAAKQAARDAKGRFTSAAAVVPEKYELKLPDGSKIDPAIVERTAADARELGLSNEAGQKLLDKRVAEATEQQTAAQAVVDAWKPGGADWTKRNTEWTAATKADPAIGGDKYDATVLAAKQALGKFGSPEFGKLLEDTGYGSHPEVVRMLAAIGKAMSEPNSLVLGSPGAASAQSTAERMYGPDGTGLKK